MKNIMEKYMFSSIEKSELESMFTKLYTIPYRFNEIPSIKPSNDPLIYGFIPEGSRFYSIFLRFNGSQYCIFLSSKKKQLVFGFQLKTSLLTLKSPIIFYGTKCQFKKKQMFCCEHVLTMGENSFPSVEKRLLLLKTNLAIVSSIGCKNSIYFSCPYFENSDSNAYHLLSKHLIPYKTKYIEIQNSKLYLVGYRKFMENDKNDKDKTMFIRSDKALPDMYYMYMKETDDTHEALLWIPDYKTSMFMNEQFKDEKDGFVQIKCHLNETKKRWVPVIC